MWSVLTVVYIGQQQQNQVVKCACNESQKSTQETRYQIFILCILFVCRPGGVQSWHRAVAFADRTRTILEQVAVLHLLFSRRKKKQQQKKNKQSVRMALSSHAFYSSMPVFQHLGSVGFVGGRTFKNGPFVRQKRRVHTDQPHSKCSVCCIEFRTNAH